MSEEFYNSLAKRINHTLRRKAISANKIKSLVKQAKQIRQQQGIFGLLNFASQLPSYFFTESEIEQLKQSPEWSTFTHQFIHLLIQEGVITPWEAKMLSRYI